MMRNKASSSMQKTYDECYLVCSTAVYFEGQNNEAEALRSWRSALDQIYYHNAYRVPANYVPKNETEKALQESLRDMEMQCKERVDLLEALRKSRKESKERERSSDNSNMRGRPLPIQGKPEPIGGPSGPPTPGWIGQGTVPPVSYPDLSRPHPPPLPLRPALPTKESDSPTEHTLSSIPSHAMPPPTAPAPTPTLYTPPPPTLPVPATKPSRTPSPDKKGGRVMLTTLRGPKDARKKTGSPRITGGRFAGAPPVSSKAAGLAWDSNTKGSGVPLRQTLGPRNTSSTTVNSVRRDSTDRNSSSRPGSTNVTDGEQEALGGNALLKTTSSRMPDLSSIHDRHELNPSDHGLRGFSQPLPNGNSGVPDLINLEPPTPPAYESRQEDPIGAHQRAKSPVRPKQPDYPSYRTEFPPQTASSRATAEFQARSNVRRTEAARTASAPVKERSPQRQTRPPKPSGISRRPVANMSSPRPTRQSSDDNDETTSSNNEVADRKKRTARKQRNEAIPVDPALSSPRDENSEDDLPKTSPFEKAWQDRVKHIKKNLPKGVDEAAAKQIFNEIVVHGDEVHWSDVAGLEVAKKALKEAVVYPFLRPDLFMGLREPARGMLLFGPPGTGKTMLARAVATESKSTFFAISASSLTSKWLGESEKLVRALFSLAKALAPSIIFVDEIDSLLSSRGGSSEHESTRRIKTEFLIQWSDLQRAAAGKQQSAKEQAEGDASRVLVLAATNTPWAIDEAARRRFVRRQYIPLPEATVRGEQLRTLLGHQKHKMTKQDIQVLVQLTDGFSGSDITALAKDAAMGPLRSLGEALLYMSHDEIRPIQFEDFEASLVNIRPSVGKEGLQEYEDWAKEFGERGG